MFGINCNDPCCYSNLTGFKIEVEGFGPTIGWLNEGLDCFVRMTRPLIFQLSFSADVVCLGKCSVVIEGFRIVGLKVSHAVLGIKGVFGVLDGIVFELHVLHVVL